MSLPNLNKTDPRSAPMRNCEIRRSGRRRDDPFQVEKVNLWVREIKVKGARASSASSQFIMMLFCSQLRMEFLLFKWGVGQAMNTEWTGCGAGYLEELTRFNIVGHCIM